MISLIFDILSEFHHKRICRHLNYLNINTIVDVGAHNGDFLLKLSKLKNVRQMFAFEPQKKAFVILKKKLSKQNCLFFKTALDEKPRYKDMFINKLNTTTTLTKFNKQSIYLKLKNFLTLSKKNFLQKNKIKTSTLDIMLNKFNLKNCLLKIDVEGYELKVLRGSKKKLKKIKFILIENQFGNHYKAERFIDTHIFLSKHNFTQRKKFLFPTCHYQDILYEKKFNK